MAAVKTFCNYSTQSVINLTVTRYIEGTWYSEGWWVLPQGQCQSVYHEGSSIWFYAQDSTGQITWNNQGFHAVTGCIITDKQFKILSGGACTNGKVVTFGEIPATGTQPLSD